MQPSPENAAAEAEITQEAAQEMLLALQDIRDATKLGDRRPEFTLGWILCRVQVAIGGQADIAEPQS